MGIKYVQKEIKGEREDNGSIFGLKNPLRKCTRCGLEAWTDQDLHKFKRNRNYLFGRANVCKKCDSEDRSEYYKKNRENISSIKRQKKIIAGFPKPIICVYCGKEITKLEGCETDSLFIHSIDGNHENWNPENKEPFHGSCHTKYHYKLRKTKKAKADAHV